MDLFDLVAKLSLDKSEYEKGLSDAEQKAGTTGGKVAQAFGTAAKAGAGLAAGVAAAGTALYGMATKSANTSDHIDKMSQKIGISRQAYQELDFICSQSGANVDNLRVGMKTLTNQMGQAASGTGDAAEVFQRLGLSVTDSSGQMKSQEEMLWETLDALQGVENQTERATLANQLFGKSGSDLMPLVNGARGSIGDMRDEAHDLGLVLSDETIDSGVVFTDTVDKIQRSLSAVATNIGAEVMPIVQQVLDWVLVNMPTIQKVIGTVFNVLGVVVSAAMDLLRKLYEWIEPHIPEVAKIFQTAFDAASGAVRTAFDVIKTLWNTVLRPVITAIADILQKTLVPVFNLVFNNLLIPAFQNFITTMQNLWEHSFKPIIEGITKFIKGVFTADWSMAWEGIKQIFSGWWEGVKTLVSSSLENVRILFSGAWEAIKTVTSTVFGGIKSVIGGVFEGIKALWQNVLQPVWEEIKNAIQGVYSAFEDIFSKISGVVASVFGAIQHVWQTVLSVVFSAISSALGTLQEVFSTIWQGISSVVRGAMEAIAGVYQTVLAPLFTTISEALNIVQSVFDTIWGGIVNTVSGAFDKIYDAYIYVFSPVIKFIKKLLNTTYDKFVYVFDGIYNTVSGVFSSIKTIVSNFKQSWSKLLNGIFEKAAEIFGGIATTISDVWEKVKGFAGGIKNFFSGGNRSKYYFDPYEVEWNAKASNTPYMFRGATLFGAGETTDEMLYGHDSLMNDIRAAVSGGGATDKLYNLLAEYLPEIVSNSSKEIVLDDGTLVGRIDRRMGYSASAYRRGV